MEKTCKGYVSPKERIARIDKIALVYGGRTSGAEVTFMDEKDFPKLSGLTEGGFAIDIHIKKDTLNKKVYIPPENDLGDGKFSNDDYDGTSQNSNNSGEGEDYKNQEGKGQLFVGADNVEEEEEKNKKIFWYNGIRTVVDKHKKDEFLIPTDLAEKVIGSIYTTDNSILDKLSKEVINDETLVSSKKLADVLNITDLYSQWEYKGVLNIMINTDMKDGEYKLKRTNKTIDLTIELNICDITDDYKSKTYPELITEAAANWATSTDWKKNEKYFDMGYDSIEVTVKTKINNRSKDYYENKNYNIAINNNEFGSDVETHRSNVSYNMYSDRKWKINQIGKMKLYNHIESRAYTKNQYVGVTTHELGHFFGLGDAYYEDKDGIFHYVKTSENDEITEDDIMHNSENGKVTANDIEMLFLASLYNEKQYFLDTNNTKKSVGIDSQTIEKEYYLGKQNEA